MFVDAALFILHCNIHKLNYQVSFVRLGTLPTFQVIYCLLISNITSKNYWYLFFCYSINYSISSPKQSQRRIIPKSNRNTTTLYVPFCFNFLIFTRQLKDTGAYIVYIFYHPKNDRNTTHHLYCFFCITQ